MHYRRYRSNFRRDLLLLLLLNLLQLLLSLLLLRLGRLGDDGDGEVISVNSILLLTDLLAARLLSKPLRVAGSDLRPQGISYLTLY